MKSQIAYLLKALALLALGWSGTAFAQEAAAAPDEVAAQETATRLEAIPPLLPTESFAGRSAFRGFHMSPDGSQLAITRTINGEGQVIIIDRKSVV